MLKIFKNPYYVYVLSFGIVFFLYSLDWSNAFPKISLMTYCFFILSFIISIFLGLAVDKLKIIDYKDIKLSRLIGQKRAIFIVFIGVFIEIIYEGSSPFFDALKGQEGIDYKDFGIKSFHVVLVSYNSFLITYFFHLFLSTKKKRIFIYYILLYIPPLLIMSRGMIMVGIISSVFVYMYSLKKIFLSFKQVLGLSIIIIIVSFIFGYLGNIRAANGDDSYIPIISGARKSFIESNVPKEFYWTYLYGASPLANFQENIDNTKKVDYNVFGLFITECIPEVFSKRIQNILNIEKKETYKIRHWLTVGTVYTKSYTYAKWLGPLIIFIYGIVLIFLLILLVNKKSDFHITMIATVSTVVFLNIFDNMYVFSGTINPVFYPIIFSLLENKKFILRKK